MGKENKEYLDQIDVVDGSNASKTGCRCGNGGGVIIANNDIDKKPVAKCTACDSVRDDISIKYIDKSLTIVTVGAVFYGKP